jgi:putative transport protein
MEILRNLFLGSGTATTILYISLTAFIGVLVGKIEVKKIKLGIAGVLFVGLFLAHFGAKPDEFVLGFVREFGLILFVYAIGLEVGPRFFSSFRDEGLKMNLFAAGIILVGYAIAYGFYRFGSIPSDVITGIMCGAVFNTPSLGSAQQAIAEHGGNLATHGINTLAMGFAVSYPFGVIGVLLSMIFIRLLFRINISKEVANYNHQFENVQNKLESVKINITNPNLFGQKINYVKKVIDKELVISRIEREATFIVATDDVALEEGDIIYGVSALNHIENLRIKLGEVAIPPKREISGDLAMVHVLITNRKLTGKTVEQIGIYRRYEANITRIFRAGIEILPTLDTTIERGDTVRIVGKREILSDIRSELGDSVKELSIPNTIPVFLGIFLGVILGSIPIFIPGLSAPAKLGLAGGPLLIAILLGHKGRVGQLDFYMTPGANMMIREIGIILFLAAVGLMSGNQFVETIANGGYKWMLYGAAITFIPVMLFAVVARLLKYNYFKICGLLAGSMTNPPALEFANSMAPIQAQSTVYATVYPLTMFLRVLLAQVLILTTL